MRKRKRSLLKRRIRVFMLRFLRGRRIEKAAVSLFCCLIVLAIFKIHALDRFELTLLDYRFRAKAPQPISKDITLIDISQDSLDEIGRWPWDRSWHASLITGLKAYGARYILYDVLFSERATKKQDLALEAGMARAGNVYIPYVFNTEASRSQNPISQNSIYGVNDYIKTLRHAVKGDGFINMLPDLDGTLRRVPLIIEYGGKYHMQIAFRLACDMLGVKDKDIIIKRGKYIRLPLKDGRAVTIPIDNNYQMLINWPGTWKNSFRHLSFIDVVKSFRMMARGLEPDVPAESLKNKVCIVGMAAAGLIDIRPTPVEPLYPAMGINACILDNILRGDFFRQLSGGFTAVLIILLVIATTRCMSFRNPVRDFFLAIVIISSYALANILLFAHLKIWINIIYPALAVLITYIGLTLYNEIRVIIERNNLSRLATVDSLTGFYRKAYFNTLMKTRLTERRKASQSGSLSLIMADIDHFKHINDTYGHLFGDAALRKVARIIASICRPLDICGRYGGEEFIIMLPNTTSMEAAAIAERIRKAVEKNTIRHRNKSCKLTISLGVTSLKKESGREMLIKKADTALYAAKSRGRNRVCKD